MMSGDATCEIPSTAGLKLEHPLEHPLPFEVSKIDDVSAIFHELCVSSSFVNGVTLHTNTIVDSSSSVDNTDAAFGLRGCVCGVD